MSDTKFTPAPWRCVDGTKVGAQVLFVDKEGEGVVCRLTKSVHTHLPLSEQDIANANLIAAAPDMYKMLEQMTKFRDSYSGDEVIQYFLDNTDDIEKLLAKARGES